MAPKRKADQQQISTSMRLTRAAAKRAAAASGAVDVVPKTEVPEKKAKKVKPAAKGKGKRKGRGKGKQKAEEEPENDSERAESAEETEYEEEVSRNTGDVADKTIIIEHCTRCQTFKKRADMVKQGLEERVLGITVIVNPEKPRVGCFEIREQGGETFISLMDMKRPYKPLTGLDMADLISDIIQKIN